MLEILGLMAAGILAGRLLRKRQKVVSIVERLILVSIFLLLFFLGASIGSDRAIVDALDTIGLNALITATGSVAGSLVAAWLLWKYLFMPKTPSK